MFDRLTSLIAETWTVIGEIWASPAWRRVALWLFPYAGMLTGLCVAAHYGELTNAPLPRQFFFATDGGFGEWLEYAMTASVAVLLVLMWRRNRVAVYLANAAMFIYLTLDNSLQIHEKFGYAVGAAFADWPLPVRPNDIGEAALFASVGLVWLVALGLSLRKAQLRPAIYSLILAAGVGATAFFGVIVDLMVVWGYHTPALSEIETFIEDGGEFAMLCLTFLMAIAIFDIERGRSRQP